MFLFYLTKILNQAFYMIHTFDSEVSLHSWLFWPTVRRRWWRRQELSQCHGHILLRGLWLETAEYIDGLFFQARPIYSNESSLDELGAVWLKKSVRYLTILPNVSITFFESEKGNKKWNGWLSGLWVKEQEFGFEKWFQVLLFYHGHPPANNGLK